MKKILSIIFISFFLLGCYNNKSPEVVIPSDDPPIDMEMMSDILVEMHIVQSTIKQLQVKRKDIEGITEEHHARIFKDYGITKEDFDKSIEYYNYRTEELKIIYEEVITKLSLMDSELKSQRKDTIQ